MKPTSIIRCCSYRRRMLWMKISRFLQTASDMKECRTTVADATSLNYYPPPSPPGHSVAFRSACATKIPATISTVEFEGKTRVCSFWLFLRCGGLRLFSPHFLNRFYFSGELSCSWGAWRPRWTLYFFVWCCRERIWYNIFCLHLKSIHVRCYSPLQTTAPQRL